VQRPSIMRRESFKQRFIIDVSFVTITVNIIIIIKCIIAIMIATIIFVSDVVIFIVVFCIYLIIVVLILYAWRWLRECVSLAFNAPNKQRFSVCVSTAQALLVNVVVFTPSLSLWPHEVFNNRRRSAYQGSYTNTATALCTHLSPFLSKRAQRAGE